MTSPRRGRPPGTGKRPGTKFVQRGFKIQPELWRQFAAMVPARERSAHIRWLIIREIRQRTGEAFSVDPGDWCECPICEARRNGAPSRPA